MSAVQDYPYETFLNVLLPPLKVVDVPSLVAAHSQGGWYNQTLCQVNDSVVRLGVMQGDITGTSTSTMTSFSLFSRAASSLTWRIEVLSLASNKDSLCPKGRFTVHGRRSGRSS